MAMANSSSALSSRHRPRPAHVHPSCGTRWPTVGSDPCFWNVWMVTALRTGAQVDDEDPTSNQTNTCRREQGIPGAVGDVRRSPGPQASRQTRLVPMLVRTSPLTNLGPAPCSGPTRAGPASAGGHATSGNGWLWCWLDSTRRIR